MNKCYLRKWTSHCSCKGSLGSLIPSCNGCVPYRVCADSIPLRGSQAFHCTVNRPWLSHRPPKNFSIQSKSRNHHHQQSKKVGRQAALASPLYYPSTAIRYDEKGASAAEGQSEGPMPDTDGFRLSFDYQRKVGSRAVDELVGRESPRDTVRKPSPQSLPIDPPLMPDSFLAYRTLLRKGGVTHIMELVTSPYAPGPLQVIHEVLNEISVLKEELRYSLQSSLMSASKTSGIGRNDSTNERRCDESSEFGENLKRPDKAENVFETDASPPTFHPIPSHSSCDGEENVLLHRELIERIVSLERLEGMMSRSADLRAVLQSVERDVRGVVQTKDTIGDRESDLDLQKTIYESERFASYVFESEEHDVEAQPLPILDDRCVVEVQEPPRFLSQGLRTAGGSQGRRYTSQDIASLLAWQPPVNVYAELLHGILRLSHHLGTHLTAVRALERLIELSAKVALHEERKMLTDAGGPVKATFDEVPLGSLKETGALVPQGAQTEESNTAEREEFCIDDVVAVVDAELQAEFVGVIAQDHICAIASCQRVRDFSTAYSLYLRLLQHARGWKHGMQGSPSAASSARGFLLTTDDLTQAFTALAHCARSTPHFEQLRALLIEDEATQSMPVSVPLYTALIDAVSRATETPNRMAIALAFYRRLRDGRLLPSVETYAGLMACCAATSEPTQAFAFYHEARQLYGVGSFSPALYTNLLLAYANAGYGGDARRTLEVLVEAGAPLTASAFHAVLRAAATLREAEEVVAMMAQQYHIAPTPYTYAFLVHAAAKQPAGVQTALKLFDLHEEALAALLRVTSDNASGSFPSASGVQASLVQRVAVCTESKAATLEERLLQDYPLYVRALEHALMRLRLDPRQDPRLLRYLKPLMRIAQRRMNAFTGMAPQAPTFIPAGAHPCVAVLAPDVLADIDELVMPFIAYYSVIVVPYSSLLALQVGGGRRVEGGISKEHVVHPSGATWQSSAAEHDAMVEYRRKRLVKFLKDYQEVIHLVSLEEELTWSRDARRYGILNTKDLQARSAVFALNLPRSDIPHSMKLYANNEKVSIILVSTNYTHCGRYVVDLKRGYLSPKSSGDFNTEFEGLRTGLKRVFYHNPRTQPNWAPPSLSIQAATTEKVLAGADSSAGVKRPSGVLNLVKESVMEPGIIPEHLALHLYHKHLLQCENAYGDAEGGGAKGPKQNHQHVKPSLVVEKVFTDLETSKADRSHIMADPNQTDEAIDAEMLMAMMNP